MAMYLDEARVRPLLHWDALIAAMESALAAFSSGRVIQPVRNMIIIEEGRRYLGIMPAVAEDVMPGQCRHRGSDASGHDRPASLGHR